MGEEQEEEIWEEDGEFETMWISPMHLFQVDFLSAPLNSSGFPLDIHFVKYVLGG